MNGLMDRVNPWGLLLLIAGAAIVFWGPKLFAPEKKAPVKLIGLIAAALGALFTMKIL